MTEARLREIEERVDAMLAPSLRLVVRELVGAVRTLAGEIAHLREEVRRARQAQQSERWPWKSPPKRWIDGRGVRVRP